MTTISSTDATARLLRAAIGSAVAGEHLGPEAMRDVVDAIMAGGASPAQIGALLTALRMKGETVDELVGAATAMRDRAAPLACPELERSIDTCGTGGDGAGTLNVSTLAAILLAACGATVAKHGNRALSSKCGSADVLEALGIAIDGEPAAVEHCLADAGIGFAFAPRFHAATRHASGPRKELGTRTIFNLLGPLTNPAHVRQQVVGVYDRRWCEPMAAALGALGVRHAAVVHAASGLDEVAVRGPTYVAVYSCGVETYELTPKDFGCDEIDPAGLAGGDAMHNASVLGYTLAGQLVGHGEPNEAFLQAAAMTAALGLALLDGAFSLLTLPDHYARARDVAFDGTGTAVLHRWRDASHP